MPPRPAAKVTPGRIGKKGVLTQLDQDTARRLKMLAVEHDTTLQALGLAALGADAAFQRVALTHEQIDAHDLIPQPTKSADTRSSGYSADGSWELEALPVPALVGHMSEKPLRSSCRKTSTPAKPPTRPTGRSCTTWPHRSSVRHEDCLLRHFPDPRNV